MLEGLGQSRGALGRAVAIRDVSEHSTMVPKRDFLAPMNGH